MSLSFNDDVEEHELGLEYLGRKYDLDQDRLMQYCEEILKGSILDEQGLITAFIVGFEFGMVYERYEADMRRLS